MPFDCCRGNVVANRGQLVLATVPARRLRRLFESLRATHFHHEYRQQDPDRRRSLLNAQMLAGHSNLQTAQAYIEANPEARCGLWSSSSRG